MSPTSSLLLYPAIYRCKGTTFFLITKTKMIFLFYFLQLTEKQNIAKRFPLGNAAVYNQKSYSTVTDLAKFRGWSTLQPRIVAI